MRFIDQAKQSWVAFVFYGRHRSWPWAVNSVLQRAALGEAVCRTGTTDR